MKLGLLASMAAVTLTPGSGSQPLSPSDLAGLDRVSAPQVSPDGASVIYAVRTTDPGSNRSETSIWRMELDDPHSLRRLASSDGGAVAAKWSPDGQSIYFLSARSGSMQVWRSSGDGGKLEQITNLPLDVQAFRPDPSGRKLVVGLAVFPDCADLHCTAKRLAHPSSGTVHEAGFFRHWSSWRDGTRNQLFSVPIEAHQGMSADVTPLTNAWEGDVPTMPFGDEGDFTVTRDSVIFSSRRADRAEPSSVNFDLWKVPLNGKADALNLTSPNRGWDAQPVISPDGRHLAYRSTIREGFEADRFRIMILDLKTGIAREVAPEWDRSALHIAWSRDGKTLYATAMDRGQTRIFAVSPGNGAVSPLTGDGHVTGFDEARNGIVYVADRLDAPAQVFLKPRAGKPVALTSHNREKLNAIRMGDFEQFSFAGWNGEKVHGYLVKPAFFDPAKKYPVVFLIHGGPQSSFGNEFYYRTSPQNYAGAGYAVVMIDFHGSVGYGQEFTDSVSRHWHDRPLEDLQKGWAAALDRYSFLDGDRACAVGGSFGGYMTNLMAGAWPKPWKCLVTHAGIFDLRGWAYSTAEQWFVDWEFGAKPHARPQDFEIGNPMQFVSRWSVPMLVIHGDNDFAVPVDQGVSAFTALQSRNIPSAFLHFSDEGHVILKPDNNIKWHKTVVEWLDRWTSRNEDR